MLAINMKVKYPNKLKSQCVKMEEAVFIVPKINGLFKNHLRQLSNTGVLEKYLDSKPKVVKDFSVHIKGNSKIVEIMKYLS